MQTQIDGSSPLEKKSPDGERYDVLAPGTRKLLFCCSVLVVPLPFHTI